MPTDAYIAAERRQIEGMTLADAARYCCKEGMSKAQACQVMQIHHEHLQSVLAGMERLYWPSHGKSNAYRDAQDRQRNVCTPAQAESLARARKQRLADQVYTVRGVTASLPELYKRFECPCSLRQVQRRVAEGMDAEQALLTPSTRSNQHRSTRSA